MFANKTKYGVSQFKKFEDLQVAVFPISCSCTRAQKWFETCYTTL